MATLLLRCVGPMQSWGISSAFELRGTEHEPSKSGIIGLVCAALGRDRNEPIDDLSFLKMGVRVDQAGRLEKDFQTAMKVAKASSGTETQTSKRYYLADAAFLIGLEGNKALLEVINQALKNPVWPLFLGRKSYIPSWPIAFPDKEIEENPVDKNLWQALTQAKPLFVPDGSKIPPMRVQMECEPDDEDAMERPDCLVSFAYGHRDPKRRYVKNREYDFANKVSSNVL